MPVQPTNISWTDYSANHWVACAKTSEGCRYCWAAGMASRFDRTPEPWTIANVDENLSVYDEDITDRLYRKKPGWCFYPSSSDPYLPALPEQARDDYYESIGWCTRHCFQVLTKWGPDRQRGDHEAAWEYPSWPENVILGTSVESPRRRYRIDWLREQTAFTKFVSFEPLIEPIPDVDLSGIDWIIVGGESHRDNSRRREMNPEWAVRLLELAREYDVAFFFKQHSGLYPEEDRLLDAGDGPREYNEFPETPSSVFPDMPREPLDGKTVV